MSSSSLALPVAEGDEASTESLVYSNDKHKEREPPAARGWAVASAWLLLLVGWNYPRYRIQIDNSIVQKKPPYRLTNSGDVILDFLIEEPLIDPPTIPSNLLVWTSVYIPFIAVLVTSWWYRAAIGRQWLRRDALSGLSGLAMAIGIGEGSTQMLKLAIQRRRPNFYALCSFDIAQRKCMGDVSDIKEANFSFPSGHSSLSACGMTYVALYIAGKIWLHDESVSKLSESQQSQRVPPQFQALLVYLLLEGWTVMVAASRLVDKWHHPSDVVAGLLLGSITATIIYHVWYTPFSGKARL